MEAIYVVEMHLLTTCPPEALWWMDLLNEAEIDLLVKSLTARQMGIGSQAVVENAIEKAEGKAEWAEFLFVTVKVINKQSHELN